VAFLKELPAISRAGATLCMALFTVAIAIAQVDLALMRDVALSRYGPHTAAIVDDWTTTIEAMKSLPDLEKLEQANAFFNSRIRWREDAETWGQSDYWATPLEVMGSGAADCEDFAIAKYATLVLSGVDIDKLRITYVKAQLLGKDDPANSAHMVLAYYPTPTAEPLILDNPHRSEPILSRCTGSTARASGWVALHRPPATNPRPGCRAGATCCAGPLKKD
jgi:predicted transglutaminase-like cysteine proteinase